jgi:hypothetical protein
MVVREHKLKAYEQPHPPICFKVTRHRTKTQIYKRGETSPQTEVMVHLHSFDSMLDMLEATSCTNLYLGYSPHLPSD